MLFAPSLKEAFILKKNIRTIVFVALYVAMAIAFDYTKNFIPFNEMPSGGSYINLALIPLVIASCHFGLLQGMGIGLLYWVIASLLGLNPYYLNAFQYLFDYIIPAVSIGFVGIYALNKKIYMMELGIVLMSLSRFLTTLISGAYFWLSDGAVAGSTIAWANSFRYNFGYNFSSMVILMIICPIIFKRIEKILEHI